MTHSRRDFLKKLSASSLALTLPGYGNQPQNKPAQQPSTKPNIIFILADDLGYGDLGCYGQQQIRTPNLDRLAAEGMKFTDHYAGSTVCAPSRCCLMTGLHTGHARVRGNQRVPLRPADLTVAELLQQADYTTGIFGKWGLGEPETTGIPNRKGFDEWFGYLNQRHAHNYYPEFLWKNKNWIWFRENAAGQQQLYSHDLIHTEAMKFVKANYQQPFFLYLAYTIPHANNEMGRLTGNGMEVPDNAPYSNENWPLIEKNFAAMITKMDSDIGQLMALLKELGIDENTVVFFSSDNGPHREGGTTNENGHDPDFFQSSGPLRGIKRDLYEGGIRVPLIVRWPGKIKPATTSNHVSAFWDFLPTACEIAGITPPSAIDGISFLSTLLGQTQTAHEYLYWEFHEGQSSKQAIRLENWKAVRLSPNGPVELYDLNTDLGEQQNVAAQHPQIVRKSENILATVRTENEFWPLKYPR